MNDTPDWACEFCGHPCPVEGLTIPARLDFDHAGKGRARCEDTGCLCEREMTTEDLHEDIAS